LLYVTSFYSAAVVVRKDEHQ